MATNETMKARIANMNEINLAVSDSNYHREIINMTHDEACRLVNGDILYSYEIMENSRGKFMTITIQ